MLAPMTSALEHRGPDDYGLWCDSALGVGLGHRRLSIIDLSPQGHQPMFSASGRYVVVFNGEIYNFERLRKELPRTLWRGHSDTEVILAAVETWGLELAVTRLVGIFAFAIWDRAERKLHFVRDHMGVKPLYYGWNNRHLLFASEVKSIRSHPHFSGELDRNAIATYLRYGYIPAPHSIYKGIYKLEPGTIATFAAASDEAHVTRYWSASEAAVTGMRQPFIGSATEATEQLEKILLDAVGLQMVSDVPLGAFLSGGIDSSLVVSLMQAQSSRPVRSFSIGFRENEYNEAPHAAAIARHLGTDHTELYITEEHAQQHVPTIASLYDEPFADSSQLPTFLVSRLARNHVTVSLSGDGGDELFAGYNRYAWTNRTWRWIRMLGSPTRRILGKVLLSIPPRYLNRLLYPFSAVLPPTHGAASLSQKIYRLSNVMQNTDRGSYYRGLSSIILEPEKMMIGATEAETSFETNKDWRSIQEYISQMQCLDMLMYLPDDILVKVDRASMAVGLEARVPLLDHRVVEFAWSIPLSLKAREKRSKWLLHCLLEKYVPRPLFERPKMGFGVPIGQWLRGALRDWTESLLDPARLNSSGLLNAAEVHRIWTEHCSLTYDWKYQLWNILMLQSWIDSAATPSRQNSVPSLESRVETQPFAMRKL